LFLALFALVVLAVIVFVVLPRGHVGRIAVTFAPLALSLWVAIMLARKRRWFVRLGWLAGGLVLASAAWLFVPTAQGLNLWSAYRLAEIQVQELEALEPGETADFLKATPARENLVAQFPSFKAEIDEAEEAWLDRSTKLWVAALSNLRVKDVDGLEELRDSYLPLCSKAPFQGFLAKVSEAEMHWKKRSIAACVRDMHKLPPGKFSAFRDARAVANSFPNPAIHEAELEWLVRTCRRLKPENFKGMTALRAAATGPQRTDARLKNEQAAWADRTAKAILARANPLIRRDPAKASAGLQVAAKNLAAFPPALNLLQPARRQALQARLDAAFRQVTQLAIAEPATDRARELDDIAARLAEDVDREAAALQMEKTLADFRKKCEFLSKLSRAAAKKEKPK
jgi:hypothetical protein